MDDKKWIVAKASVPGERHRTSEIPCQDAFSVTVDKDALCGLAVVSDGAGSAVNSDIGSKTIAENSFEIITAEFELDDLKSIFLLEDDEIHNTFMNVFYRLHHMMNQIANDKAVPLKSLAATAIVVIFAEQGIVCSHVGDGRAGFQDLDGNWLPILDPFKGEEANQTIFITSDIWHAPNEFVRTNVFRGPIQSFTVMSDGCESATYQLNKFNDEFQRYERMNNPHAPFFDPNVKALKSLHLQGKSEEEIDLLWESFLIDGNDKFKSEQDDKTLILGTLNMLNAEAV